MPPGATAAAAEAPARSLSLPLSSVSSYSSPESGESGGGAVLEDSTVAAADVAGGGHLLLGQHRGGGAMAPRRAWSEWRVRPSVHSSSFRRLYDALRCPAQPESARDAEGLARLLVNGNFLPSTHKEKSLLILENFQFHFLWP